MDVTPSQPEPYRRLTLLDLMGLVVAAGLGMAGHAAVQQEGGQAKWPSDAMEWYFLVAVEFWAVAWFLVLRGLGRLAAARREPGFLTALGMLVGWVCSTALLFVYGYGQPPWNASIIAQRVLQSLIGAPGFLGSAGLAAGILTVWVMLLALSAWRPTMGTLDRLGRWLGLAYLLLTVAGYARLLWLKTIP